MSRATVAQQLDRMTPEWDALCRRAGQTATIADVHDVEEAAQRFADRLVAAVRGAEARRPSRGPLGGYRTGAYI